MLTEPEDHPEKLAAIRTIRKLMDFWRIEPAEIGPVPLAPPPPRPAAPAVRYRHPVSGDQWDGVGPQPDWLKRALLKEGYTVDELRAAAHQADDVATATPSEPGGC